MKKLVVVIACLLLSGMTANAQLGSLIQKAAQKTSEKLTDKAAEAAAKALEEKLDKQKPKDASAKAEPQANTDETLTYASLMKQAQELPTVQQLTSFKSAELNEQAFKLLTSPVTSFNSKVMSLSMQALSLSMQGLDSAQVVEGAYNLAQLSTGMTKEELEHLASLPEDQQEAYIAAHYRPGAAEAAMVSQASDISKYLEPLQPLIDKWGEVGEKADAFLALANEKCKGVYKKYASDLAKASDKERVSILLKYYAEIVEYQRTAVQQAMRVRLDEQLPIAEDIEKKMVTIRAEHPDIVSAFMNYPQLTATQYFADVAKLIEVPEFND